MQNINLAKFLICLFVILFSLSTSYAENQTETKLVATNTIVPDIQKIIADVKTKTSIPVFFPTSLPAKAGLTKYFASTDLFSDGTGYTINIDSTKECQGAHYCNLGYFSAKKGANPQMYSDMANKNITVPITLANQVKGYYTPGHAMADYFPANIQWQENGVLYTISWDTNDTNIRNMANSAISQGSK